MDIVELQDFVDWEMKRIEELNGKSNEEMKPWSIVKLAEAPIGHDSTEPEVGELADEVGAHSSLHRKDKMDGYSCESFEKEFADVVITACIVARRHGVDIVDALNKKIEIIRGRKY